MISFQPSEEQLLATDMLDALARDVLRPLARQCDQTGTLTPPVHDALNATGLIELALIPAEPEHQPAVSNAMALEAIAYADASFAVALGASLGHARAIMRFGSPAQRSQLADRWSGNPAEKGAILIQEPGFAADVTAPRCVLRREGEKLILSGAKAMVPCASGAGEFIVVAAFEGARAAIVVPTDTPGVECLPAQGTLGLRSLALAEVNFNDVVLPASALLGGDSPPDVQWLIDSARVANSAIVTGVARAVLDQLVPYLKERKAHGSALAMKQSVAFRLADMSVDIPSMRWMTWRAAAMMDQSRMATREARLAHTHCVEQALWITDEGVQLMGGHGYMRDNPVERWYRDVRTLAGLQGMTGL